MELKTSGHLEPGHLESSHRAPVEQVSEDRDGSDPNCEVGNRERVAVVKALGTGARNLAVEDEQRCGELLDPNLLPPGLEDHVEIAEDPKQLGVDDLLALGIAAI